MAIHQTPTNKTPLQSLRDACSWPSLYYQAVDKLIKTIRPNVMVEIGVALGLHARHILQENPSLIYFGIDPYLAEYDNKDIYCDTVMDAYGLSVQESMDRLYIDVLNDLKSTYPDRCFLYRMKSVEASSYFLDSTLNFVFIDGDHTKEAVYSDLVCWHQKISPAGIIVGDDYSWPDVQAAVTSFCHEGGFSFDIVYASPNYPLYTITK